MKRSAIGGARRDRSLTRSRPSPGACLCSAAAARCCRLHAASASSTTIWQGAVQRDHRTKMSFAPIERIASPAFEPPGTRIEAGPLNRGTVESGAMDRGPMSQNSSGRQGRETGVCPTVPAFRRFFSNLGPGLITGVADDDPGRHLDVFGSPAPMFGYTPSWTALSAPAHRCSAKFPPTA